MSGSATTRAPVTVQLRHPITVGGEEVREIALIRPTVRHLLAYDRAEGDMGKMAALLEEVAQLTPGEVQQIDAADFLAIAEVLSDFLARGPATGGPSASSSPASSTAG